MSKSFDAPKCFQPAGSEHGSDRMPATPRAERRRAPRWNAHVPVFVYGHNSIQAPFHEEAYSAVVSDRGALLIMTTAVPVGGKLLLTNKVTQTEQECRVASVGGRDGPSVEVAVEFSAAAPQFWRVTAPPQRAAPLSAAPIQHKRAL